MKENNIMKIMIPIVAVVVIWESIMLVNNLQKIKVQQTKKEVSTTITPSPTVKIEKQSAFDLVFGAGNKEMKLGKSYPIEVNLVGKDNYNLDSIALYVKYDSVAFDVSNLIGGEKLSKPTFSKVSAAKNLVVVNYLLSEPSGFKVNKNDIVSVLKFDVRPKKAGNFDFEIATGNDDKNSATMFVENATNGVLPFSSNKLNVNVLK